MPAKDAALRTDVPPLQPYQERVVERVTGSEPRMLLMHGLGSGKTRSGLAAAESAAKPYAVVAPASLRAQWGLENAKWTDQKTPHDILSYNQVALGQEPKADFDTLIVDEGHRLRGGGTSAQAVARLADRAHRLLLLSGSPIVNAPHDLAMPLSLLRQEPMSQQQFDKRFVGKEWVYPGLLGRLQGVKPVAVPTMQNQEELAKLLRGHVDYQPSRTPDGVETNTERIEVPLGHEQADFHRLLWGKLPWLLRWKLSRDYPLDAGEAQRLGSFMAGHRQAALSLYPWMRTPDPLKAFQQSPKLQTAMTRLQTQLQSDPRSKAIVYSNFIDAGLQPYAAALQHAGVPAAILHGGMNDEERKQALANYNEGRARVLLLGPAAAEGISTRGTQLIQLLDPHWNETRMAQAQGRGLRFDSHAGLPPELRNVKIERYIATMPSPGVVGRLLGSGTGPTADEVLERQAQRKEQLLEQYRDVLRQVGSEPPGRSWWPF